MAGAWMLFAVAASVLVLGWTLDAESSRIFSRNMSYAREIIGENIAKYFRSSKANFKLHTLARERAVK